MMGQTDETSARHHYQLSLQSLLVLGCVVAAFAWGNLTMRVISEKVMTRSGVTHALRESGLGWPWAWQHRSRLEVDLTDNKKIGGYSSDFDETPTEWGPLAADVGVGLALAVVAVLACERIVRRTRKGAAPAFESKPLLAPTVKFTRRRAAVVLGCVLLLALAAHMVYDGQYELHRLRNGEKNIVFCELDVHLNHYENISTIGDAVRRGVSSQFIYAALLAMVAILALKQRFTLKALFLSGILVAVSGLAPLMITVHAPTTAYMRIHLNVPPSAQAFDQMRPQLQPEVVFAKMPAVLSNSIAINPSTAIQNFKLEAPMAFDKSVYASMTLVFDPSLSKTQIETILDYYWHYYRTLTLENTTEHIPDSIVLYENLTKSQWTKGYEAEWDAEWKRAKAAVTAVASDNAKQ